MLLHVHLNGCNLKRLTISHVSEDVRQLAVSCAAGGSLNWCIHFGKSLPLAARVKIFITFDSHNFFKEMHARGYLFIVAKMGYNPVSDTVAVY